MAQQENTSIHPIKTQLPKVASNKSIQSTLRPTASEWKPSTTIKNSAVNSSSAVNTNKIPFTLSKTTLKPSAKEFIPSFITQSSVPSNSIANTSSTSIDTSSTSSNIDSQCDTKVKADEGITKEHKSPKKNISEKIKDESNIADPVTTISAKVENTTAKQEKQILTDNTSETSPVESTLTEPEKEDKSSPIKAKLTVEDKMSDEDKKSIETVKEIKSDSNVQVKDKTIQENDNSGPKIRLVYTIKLLFELQPNVCPVPSGILPIITSGTTSKTKSSPQPSFSRQSSHGSTNSRDNFRRSSSSADHKSGRGGRKQSQYHRASHDTAPALEDCAPLQINEETRWKPTLLSSKAAVDGVVDTESSLKEAKSILNKLSIEKFEKLSNALIDVAVRSLPVLEGTIDLVMKKAQMEWHFSTMYAELCGKLASTEMPSLQTNPENDLHPAEQSLDTNKLFRKLLLSRCQKEFEVELQLSSTESNDAEISEAEAAERFEKEIILKRKSLGHIRFVGELYKQNMLTSRIMHECVQRFFGDSTSPDEESLECLCKFLTTIGQRLEGNITDPEQPGWINKYYAIINNLASGKSMNGEEPAVILCTRVRFMLKDLIELRKSNWVARREEAKATTIAEVHAEVAQEEKKKQQKNQTPRLRLQRSASTTGPPSLTRRLSGGGGASPAWKERAAAANSVNTDSDGWSTVTGSSRGKATRPGSQKAIPASTGGLPRHPQPPTSSTSNPFAMLKGASSSNRARSSSHPTPMRDRRNSSERINKHDRGNHPDQTQSEKPTKQLSREDFQSRVDSIIKDYVIENDVAEVRQYIEELESADYHDCISARAIDLGLNQGDKERNAMSMLLASLLGSQNALLSCQHVLDSINEIVEFLSDMEIDIPLTLNYLGRMLSDSIAQKYFTLGDVLEIEQVALLPAKKKGTLIGSILHSIDASDEDKLALFNASQLTLDMFIKDEEQDEFIVKFAMEYIL